MTRREYDEMSKILAKIKKVTRDDLLKIITKISPNRNPLHLQFFIFDLVNENIIYKLNKQFYKYNDKLRPFEYEYTKFDESLENLLAEKFKEVEICIWNTSFLAKFVNLLPSVIYTFIEVEQNFQDYLFNYLRSEHNVLINPSGKELELYSKGNNRLIIRKLFVRAPIVKPYNHSIAINKNMSRRKNTIYKPTIEKILVDIFAESNRYDVFNDIDEIFIGIFNTYCINFQKLFAYSKYRGLQEEITEFIFNKVQYDFNQGEFRWLLRTY